MSDQAQWWYIKQQKRVGPISAQELRQLAAVGEVTPDTLIWQTGMAQWISAARAEGLFNQQASVHAVNQAPSLSPLFAWAMVGLLGIITVAVTLYFTLYSPYAYEASHEKTASAARPSSPPAILKPNLTETSATPDMSSLYPEKEIAPVEPIQPVAPVAPTAVAAKAIPSQFHGEWQENLDWCTSNGTDGNEGFTIESKGYAVYEGYCDLEQVLSSDSLSFSGNFRCSDLGEPNENLSVIRFTLQASNKLSRDNITYHKCPSS